MNDKGELCKMSPYELQRQRRQRQREHIVLQEQQKEISEFLGFRDQKEDCMFKSFVETLDDPKNAHLKEQFVNEKWTVPSDDSASCTESTIDTDSVSVSDASDVYSEELSELSMS